MSFNDAKLLFEAHDRQQVEFRHTFPLSRTDERRMHEVDTYLFIPHSVGLNATNYARDEFYADTTALMRLDAAAQPLQSLIDDWSPSSPLRPLSMALQRFQNGDHAPSSLGLAAHTKLFAFLQSQAVGREIDALALLFREDRRDLLSAGLDAFIERARRSLFRFRRLRAAFWPFEMLCHHSFVQAMASADEFMSLSLEERLASLVDHFDSQRRYDGSAYVPRLKERIRAFAREEATHRKRYGFLVHLAHEKSSREYFTYRRSLLKKSIHQALYLDARKVKHEAILKNTIGAFGAMLAASWAWATQLPATVADLPTNTKLAFFIGAVAAYVAKDRIKATTNEYLVPKIRKFDKHSAIRGASLEEVGLGNFSGRLDERFHFMRFDEVDPRIRSIRLQGRTRRFLADAPLQEEVIQYRKVLTVQPSEGEPLPEGYGILDIFRLNIRHFLSRLDDPIEDVRYFDVDRGAFAHSELPKVYHVNVVIRVQGAGERERFEHFRIILDKEGIVRIDPIPTEE